MITSRLLQLQPFETVTILEEASLERWYDSLSIALTRPSETLGAVYLLGYSVEMMLKVAWAKLQGVAPAGNVYQALRSSRLRDLHDLELLLRVILAGRPVPIDRALANRFRYKIRLIAELWSPSLRYRSIGFSTGQYNELLSAVEWFARNQHKLWS